jgi:hypothetical protein
MKRNVFYLWNFPTVAIRIPNKINSRLFGMHNSFAMLLFTLFMRSTSVTAHAGIIITNYTRALSFPVSLFLCSLIHETTASVV